MKAWTRLLMMFGLRSEAYVGEAVKAATESAYKAGHAMGYLQGQEIGVAMGQMEGRKSLVHDLQVQFGIDGGQKVLEAEDVERLRTSLLH